MSEAGSAEAGGEPVAVETLTTLVSPATVESPLSGMRACVVVIELVERIPIRQEHGTGDEIERDVFESLGFVVLGDVATLRDEHGDEISIVVRRAHIASSLHSRGGTPLTRVPAEVAPLLAKARGRGVVCYRELTLGVGEKVLLKAVVAPTTSVVPSGYRSATRTTYVARDDLAPVVLEEVFEAPPW